MDPQKPDQHSPQNHPAQNPGNHSVREQSKVDQQSAPDSLASTGNLPAVRKETSSRQVRNKALQVLTKLQQAGFQAYFCGGCVRDQLLGRVPKDYDIVTNARPQEVRRLFRRTVLVGERFGVVRVVLGKDVFEVATFRQDGDYRDHRHPQEIVYSNAREDALRRDFTINGLFYDPRTDQIIDYVEGQQDLANKIIRTIGSPPERFAEDYLRLMRAVRFACQLDFELEAQTWEALRQMSAAISKVAAERIRDELSLILTSGAADRGISLLAQSGLLEHILPEVQALQGVPQPPEFHPEGDVWTHTMLMLSQLRNPNLELAWAVLLHDIGKPATMTRTDRIRFNGHERVGAEMAHLICQRLRFSKSTRETVVALVRNHMQCPQAPQMRMATLKRLLRMEHVELLLELHRLDSLASHGRLDSYEYCRRKLQEFGPRKLRPPRLVTGQDLIALGLQPGPLFGEILRWLEELQLEGQVQGREQALAMIQDRYILQDRQSKGE